MGWVKRLLGFETDDSGTSYDTWINAEEIRKRLTSPEVDSAFEEFVSNYLTKLPGQIKVESLAPLNESEDESTDRLISNCMRGEKFFGLDSDFYGKIAFYGNIEQENLLGIISEDKPFVNAVATGVEINVGRDGKGDTLESFIEARLVADRAELDEFKPEKYGLPAQINGVPVRYKVPRSTVL